MSKTKLSIVIVGAGGFGREVYGMLWDCFDSEQYKFKGFLGQDDSTLRAAGLSEPLLNNPMNYQPNPKDRFIMAIGAMDIRRQSAEAISEKSGQFISLIHPRSYIANTAEILNGAVIYPFAVVSNGSRLDELVHLNYYASVGHDCRVGKYCLLAPYATLNGFVNVEDEAYISTHAAIAPGRTVGYRSKVSAGSAAMQDVSENTIVFGVPGRQVKRMD